MSDSKDIPSVMHMLSRLLIAKPKQGNEKLGNWLLRNNVPPGVTIPPEFIVMFDRSGPLHGLTKFSNLQQPSETVSPVDAAEVQAAQTARRQAVDEFLNAARDVLDVSGMRVPVPEPKPSNPKDMIGSNKLPLHLWPTTATALGCVALLDGALKYGRSNFRAVGVRASIYCDAAARHLAAYLEGEDCDPDSGVPHLGHVLACVAILVEAEAAGNLTDDRMFPTNYREFVDQLTPHVARLKQLHAERKVKHYTIADSIQPDEL